MSIAESLTQILTSQGLNIMKFIGQIALQYGRRRPCFFPLDYFYVSLSVAKIKVLLIPTEWIFPPLHIGSVHTLMIFSLIKVLPPCLREGNTMAV